MASKTESDLSSITFNGDFIAGFDKGETTARFVCMLLDVFPNDEIALNGVVVKPVDRPMAFGDMIEYWMRGGKLDNERG